jgi:hypothetical protein
MTQENPDLDRLGWIAPPDPAVLDAAREVLWAAVAHEMLSVRDAVGETGETGSRRVQRETDQRETDQRETDRPGP